MNLFSPFPGGFLSSDPTSFLLIFRCFFPPALSCLFEEKLFPALHLCASREIYFLFDSHPFSAGTCRFDISFGYWDDSFPTPLCVASSLFGRISARASGKDFLFRSSPLATSFLLRLNFPLDFFSLGGCGPLCLLGYSLTSRHFLRFDSFAVDTCLSTLFSLSLTSRDPFYSPPPFQHASCLFDLFISIFRNPSP